MSPCMNGKRIDQAQERHVSYAEVECQKPRSNSRRSPNTSENFMHQEGITIEWFGRKASMASIKVNLIIIIVPYAGT